MRDNSLAMVEFVTLILGLTVGLRPVQVAVDSTVAAVEIRLDGEAVGTIKGPPWYMGVNFGDQLEPRLLEAFAFDADGNEVDRARLVINYGMANYQAVLVLDAAEEGKPRPGRVVWDAILDRRPKDIDLTFDDAEIPVDRRGRFQLPAYDPEAIHFLVAHVSFPKGEAARAELDFGGEIGERVTSALTALPLLVSERTVLPPPEEMQGWFAKGDQELWPFSAPHSGLNLVVVRDAALSADVEKLSKDLRRRGELPPEPRIDGEDSLRFVTTLRPRNGAFRAEQPRRSKTRSGIWQLITKYEPKRDDGGQRQVWTTLAAAGRFAADGDRRRAVVLLLGRRSPDRSSLTAAQAIGYLQSVRVPLFIWAASIDDLSGLSESGAKTYVGSEGLARLYADLAATLRDQRVVWVEGLHFPRRVRLTERVPAGIRLVE